MFRQKAVECIHQVSRNLPENALHATPANMADEFHLDLAVAVESGSLARKEQLEASNVLNVRSQGQDDDRGRELVGQVVGHDPRRHLESRLGCQGSAEID